MGLVNFNFDSLYSLVSIFKELVNMIPQGPFTNYVTQLGKSAKALLLQRLIW